MASQAKLTIRVGSARSHAIVSVSTTGRYVSTPVNTIAFTVNPAAIPPTASVAAFWTAILNAALASIATE